ncbi:MAG: Mov34/MPN/PAD-1 family protein [Nitrosopumilus sp.]
MIFKNKKFERQVILNKETLDSILSYCQMKHPEECFLILKGKSKNGQIKVDGLVIPPFGFSEPTFGGIPQSFLPFDMSYVGSLRSHPVESAEPTIDDLNNFFGLVTIIVKSPYDEESIFAWDSGGESITLKLE